MIGPRSTVHRRQQVGIQKIVATSNKYLYYELQWTMDCGPWTKDKLLKIEQNSYPFATQGFDCILDFGRIFVRDVEIIYAMRKANFGGKLEVLEVNLKAHSCLHRKVTAGSHNGVQVNFFSSLGVE